MYGRSESGIHGRLKSRLGSSFVEPGVDRRASEDGASLVEFALVVPLFVFLLFAFIDFGLSFGGIVAMRSEVNSAARVAAVDQVDPNCAKALEPMLCTVADRIQGLTGVNPSSVQVAIGFVSASGAPQTGDDVIVCAQAQLLSTTGLTGPFLNGRTFYAASELRLEQSPNYGSGSEYVSTGDAGSLTCTVP